MPQDILSLHRNEYHFEHSPGVRAVLSGPVDPVLVSSYATREMLENFVKELAQELKVPAERVTLYHGAEDALFKMLSWAASKRMVIQTTTWGWAEYMRMMQGLELQVVQTPLIRTEQSFEHPERDFSAALENCTERALVLLASPNNPTGHKVSQSELKRLAQRFPQHVFLVDLVYTEFSASTFEGLETYENVIALGSFSKFFGLPGLRCGFAIGRVPAVQSMALGPSPWSLNICRTAMQDIAYYQANWNTMKHTAAALQTHMTPVGQFIKTAAPFVLLRCRPNVSEEMLTSAQQKARLKGKKLTAQGELYMRWSLGAPDAGERILDCIRTLESQLGY
ncbi:MAG: aminotransferase class I/II-fold pyridoxal phosphate-dependent enzyme [Betaproteobacteria bacterium]|nr:aminotransferase class I/II-fold pyridoxal phosphate-dependent enzyme [Betaproteobacteria bacterium]